MLFYCGLVCYYRIYLFITFTKQQWGENRFFLFERHRPPLFVNCDRQAVLCSMFVLLFCKCFVPFVPLISSPNCTLFFSVFVNFIFSNFKTILLCLHVIPLVSFNDSFNWRRNTVPKLICMEKYVIFWCSKRSHTIKLGFFMCIYII